jgi:hypothetical protein
MRADAITLKLAPPFPRSIRSTGALGPRRSVARRPSPRRMIATDDLRGARVRSPRPVTLVPDADGIGDDPARHAGRARPVRRPRRRAGPHPSKSRTNREPTAPAPRSRGRAPSTAPTPVGGLVAEPGTSAATSAPLAPRLRSRRGSNIRRCRSAPSRLRSTPRRGSIAPAPRTAKDAPEWIGASSGGKSATACGGPSPGGGNLPLPCSTAPARFKAGSFFRFRKEFPRRELR